MYLNIFIITFVAWISFSSAQFTTQEPKDVESDHDLGPCDKENYGRGKLVKDHEGNEILFVCSRDNGVYAWKKGNMETKSDDTDDVMEDIISKREEATEFFHRDRRDLNHECYAECCSWEEVRDHYEHDIQAANKYWKKFQKWKKENGCTPSNWIWRGKPKNKQ